MVAIRKHAAMPFQPSIDGASQPHAETLKATGQRFAPLRFGQKLQVVPLHGKMHQAKAEAILSRA